MWPAKSPVGGKCAGQVFATVYGFPRGCRVALSAPSTGRQLPNRVNNDRFDRFFGFFILFVPLNGILGEHLADHKAVLVSD